MQVLDTAQKMKFPLKISSVKVTNTLESADLVTFTVEILNGKLHFLCSVRNVTDIFLKVAVL